MNCAALPETLIEAELFGHEAGAFTGATKARVGRFEEADGGTLFLDELGTLSMGAQERLLRAVEYGEVTRIGSSRPLGSTSVSSPPPTSICPARSTATSSAPICSTGLSFEVVTLPPLRARKGDVIVLAEHFGRRMAAEMEWDAWEGFGPAALDALLEYSWPGNVRELRNVVERAVYRWERGGPIDAIEFDPFEVPVSPGLGRARGRARRRSRCRRRPRHPPPRLPAPIFASGSSGSSANCWSRRCRPTVSTSARPRPR